jgi:type IX secretion system PorP/SprF family membrane protein
MKNKVLLQFITVFGLLLGMHSYAQQDPMYTQYMFNTLSVNPGYAGSFDAISVLGLYRTQWVGLNGAPVTQTFTVHSPIPRKQAGIGLSLVNDAVGPVHQTQLFVDYSYAIKVTETSKLRFGLKAGLGFYEGNLQDLNSEVTTDPYKLNFKGQIKPNIGVGLYYYGERGYLGLAVPKILTSSFTVNNVDFGALKRHYFLIGGYLFDLSNSIVFKPSFLLKAVEGSPLSVDLSGMFFIRERIGLGLSHRLGDSFSGLLQFFITPSLRLGYAYDYTLTPLHDYGKGTHEFMLGYDFWYKSKDKIRSPRFF